ncbi:uncharacterized protein M6B38_375600 [Iris pallida]|uniref:rRNA methylase YtqB n=1 Tax=Iris pallida TaxID=29817 RepID=A0AAX6GBZ7_IRIPA|nr:uncharacterized protein M6B38_375600 [Iris pallida]
MAASIFLSSSLLKPPMETLTLISLPFRRNLSSLRRPSPLRRTPNPNFPYSRRIQASAHPFPVAGSEEALMGFITGKRRATEVAHSVWKSIIQKGDTVIDATCGNGHDTLALLKLVGDESGRGCVYGMDIQKSALESTSSLLEISVDSSEKKMVKLFSLCHSKMEDVVPRDTLVRLVAFNLGYLPGGDKAVITRSPTTLLALEASSRILIAGGLISLVVYVGHPGGRDELETIQSFAASLPMESWISCKFEVLNRPACPVLIFLYRR